MLEREQPRQCAAERAGATLKPVDVNPIDLAWGTVLAGGVSVATYAVCQVLPDWAR